MRAYQFCMFLVESNHICQASHWRSNQVFKVLLKGFLHECIIAKIVECQRLQWLQEHKQHLRHSCKLICTIPHHGEIGITPSLLVRPTVGLMPTKELKWEGHKMEPSVSVPREIVTIFAATDIADPLLDPQGVPIVVAFPKMIAPALVNLVTTPASLGTTEPKSANEPAVVFILSLVAILSFTRIGIPCKEPAGPLVRRRSWSALSARASASGFISNTPLRIGFSLWISLR
ncbi:Uncharacterized protein G2W53_005550 [Senna tora]|uniref:Uncharacterized protein n=1 Tax=Senna tora TaxID=362788 RepID=A0A834X248_9FABA|nr:Uncharacterized protein G2W53_005550 [Senna tora]